MSQLIVCDTGITLVMKHSGQLAFCDEWRVIDSTQTEMLIAGGFSQEAFAIGFMGVVGLWAFGLGIGLISGQVRKLRS